VKNGKGQELRRRGGLTKDDREGLWGSVFVGMRRLAGRREPNDPRVKRSSLGKGGGPRSFEEVKQKARSKERAGSLREER